MELTEVKNQAWLRGILPGFSQVVLLENQVSGLLIILAIAIVELKLAGLALCSCIAANMFASYLKVDETLISSGLFGFSPVLVGIAAGVFFAGLAAFPLALIGSLLCVFLTIAVNRFFHQSRLPGLTFPFIVVTWLFIAVGFSSKYLLTYRMGQLPKTAAAFSGQLTFPDMFLKGVGEIFLLDSILASVIVLLAIFVANARIGILAVTGVFISLLFVFVLGGDLKIASLGLYSYNSILTFVALETFLTTSRIPLKILLFSLGSGLTILLDFALPNILGTVGLPTLTISFVLATWFVLYVEKQLVGK